MGRKTGCTPHDVKVSVNVPPVQLGMLDLMTRQGYHSTRSDVIRAAVDYYLLRRQREIELHLKRVGYVVGKVEVTAEDLRRCADENKPLHVRCVGLVLIGDDVTVDLARRAIGEVEVLGVIDGPQDVVAALAAPRRF